MISTSSKEVSKENRDGKHPKNRIRFQADGTIDKVALVDQFTPFVRGIARQVKASLSPQVELEDLISYGMAGLLESAERYDPKFGANFTTFSYYRVRGAIYDGLRGMGWMRRSEYRKIRFNQKATAYLESVARRSLGKVTEKRTTTEEQLEELASRVGQLVTIYVTSLEGMGEADFEDKEQERQDRQLENIELKHCVKNAIKELPEKDQVLIQLYYFEELSLEEVGKRIGLSKSWTCRRHAQIIEKLTKIFKKMVFASGNCGGQDRNGVRLPVERKQRVFQNLEPF